MTQVSATKSFVGTTQIKCDNCDESFSSYSQLKKHAKSNHEEDIADEEILTSIAIEASKDKEMFSNKVQKSFPTAQDLKLHKVQACDKCEKRFYTWQGLKRHMKNAHKRLRYSCDQCDKGFYSNSKLKKHTKDVHHEPPKAVSIHQNVAHTEIAFVNRFLSEKAKLIFQKSLQPDEPVTVNLSSDNSDTDDTESKRCDYCDQLFPSHKVLESHIKKIHFPDTNTEAYQAISD